MDHVEALEHEGALLIAAVRQADPGAPVPSCGEWAVRDLARHVGQVHRWATAVVRTGVAGTRDPTVPADDALATWLEDGLHDLAGVLRADPERPCWSFAGPTTARWWQRRQALETLVHRVDAERASGARSPVDPELAGDGVGEVVEVLHPLQVGRGRCAPPAAQVLLTASDTGASWSLQGPEPAVGVQGPAEALLLLLWRRTTLDDPRLHLRGDRSQLAAVLDDGLTP